MKFKSGDRVKLINYGRYFDEPANPFWGKREGCVGGTVKSIRSFISVYWDNGKNNGYDECDLDFINKNPIIQFILKK